MPDLKTIGLLALAGSVAIRLVNAPPVRAQTPAAFDVASVKSSAGNSHAPFWENILEQPVIDKTGLAGTFDFDLDWTPDETQYRD